MLAIPTIVVVPVPVPIVTLSESTNDLPITVLPVLNKLSSRLYERVAT